MYFIVGRAELESCNMSANKANRWACFCVDSCSAGSSEKYLFIIGNEASECGVLTLQENHNRGRFIAFQNNSEASSTYGLIWFVGAFTQIEGSFFVGNKSPGRLFHISSATTVNIIGCFIDASGVAAVSNGGSISETLTALFEIKLESAGCTLDGGGGSAVRRSFPFLFLPIALSIITFPQNSFLLQKSRLFLA
jgi:hypothetical protein